MDRSNEIFDRALNLFPGGVNSPVRAFRSVGGTPRVIERAQGCRIVDVDQRTYFDYVGSWGALIAGHAHPAVIDSVERVIRRGTSFGALSELEVQLAEEIVARIPSIEKLRFVNSGTEAVMSAIRLARAVTGRPCVLKFEGGYHGHVDSMLVRAGSGAAAPGAPDSPGVTPETASHTLLANYNDLESVTRAFSEHGSRIAAVIVEPVAGNMGVVPPEANFLPFLRSITQKHGSLLLFDEVITGFRLARGGAQQLFGIRPDLTILGKIIGGGFPVGAFGGDAKLMEWIAPVGPVYQAGTLSGNPVAMAAGLATLQLLDEAAYLRLEKNAARLEVGLRAAANDNGILATIQRAGSMLTIFFTNQCVRDFHDARSADHQRYAEFFHKMLRNGVYLPPGGYEAWFVSLSHDDDDIDATIEAARTAM